VRHWLRGGKADESERIADLVKFGIGEAAARAFVMGDEAAGPVTFGVWSANGEALGVFLRLKRQWRLHPFSGKPVGLDHVAIPATLRLMGIPPKRWPAIFSALGVCEDVVLGG
jgi:hypothetical protein